MKNKKTLRNRMKLMFLGLLLMVSFAANAQIQLPGDGTVKDVPDAPIDGFISIGLIAGACIGLRKHLKGKEVKE